MSQTTWSEKINFKIENLLRLIWLSDFYDIIILSMFLFLVHLSYSSNWNFNNENMILQGFYIIIRGGGAPEDLPSNLQAGGSVVIGTL